MKFLLFFIFVTVALANNWTIGLCNITNRFGPNPIETRCHSSSARARGARTNTGTYTNTGGYSRCVSYYQASAEALLFTSDELSFDVVVLNKKSSKFDTFNDAQDWLNKVRPGTTIPCYYDANKELIQKAYTSPHPGKSSSQKAGTIAGIVIGSVAGAIILLLCAWFCFVCAIILIESMINN
jgi:hypothetical protein